MRGIKPYGQNHLVRKIKVEGRQVKRNRKRYAMVAKIVYWAVPFFAVASRRARRSAVSQVRRWPVGDVERLRDGGEQGPRCRRRTRNNCINVKGDRLAKCRSGRAGDTTTGTANRDKPLAARTCKARKDHRHRSRSSVNSRKDDSVSKFGKAVRLRTRAENVAWQRRRNAVVQRLCTCGPSCPVEETQKHGYTETDLARMIAR